jgi:SAM-dependent methyltransferase
VDSILEEIKQFTHDQYSNEKRLEARIQLYKYCEHKTNFHQWIFDKLDFKNVINVLELGCGNGTLWKENIERIPGDVSITLSDISEGMVDAAKKALGGHDNQFKFQVTDACRTPFHEASFQMIIANHVLYHINNIRRILVEINRLLKDDGFAYASTLSMKNLQQLMDVAVRFSEKLEFNNDIIRGFNLENGGEVLSEDFNVREIYIYGNDVIVKNSKPLLFYLASIYEGEQLDFYIDKFDEFRKYVDSVIDSNREIRINNRNALFKFVKR